MIVVLSCDYVLRLAEELQRAGSREIGGVLVGENLGDERFSLLDFSVQRRGGGRAHFRRDPAKAAKFVDAVIAREGGDPSRVNYLGEWHSHPNCAALPSAVDVVQMHEIVDDPNQPAQFSVLMVVRLAERSIQMSMTLFRPGIAEQSVVVELTDGQDVEVVRPEDGPQPTDAEADEMEQPNA